MEVIIYGVGKQAELTYYYFTHDSPYTVAGFCLEQSYLGETERLLLGLPVVAFEQVHTVFPATHYQLNIAVGQNKARRRLFEAARAQGYQFASYISSQVKIWPNLVGGENLFIDGSMTVHPYVTLGDNIMCFGTIIGHHNRIGSHTLLSGCTLGGSVTVGDGSFIGMGAVVNEGITIGRNNIIGSGCLITRNTADNAIYSVPNTKPRLVDATRFNLFS